MGITRGFAGWRIFEIFGIRIFKWIALPIIIVGILIVSSTQLIDAAMNSDDRVSSDPDHVLGNTHNITQTDFTVVDQLIDGKEHVFITTEKMENMVINLTFSVTPFTDIPAYLDSDSGVLDVYIFDNQTYLDWNNSDGQIYSEAEFTFLDSSGLDGERIELPYSDKWYIVFYNKDADMPVFGAPPIRSLDVLEYNVTSNGLISEGMKDSEWIMEEPVPEKLSNIVKISGIVKIIQFIGTFFIVMGILIALPVIWLWQRYRDKAEAKMAKDDYKDKRFILAMGIFFSGVLISGLVLTPFSVHEGLSESLVLEAFALWAITTLLFVNTVISALGVGKSYSYMKHDADVVKKQAQNIDDSARTAMVKTIMMVPFMVFLILLIARTIAKSWLSKIKDEWLYSATGGLLGDSSAYVEYLSIFLIILGSYLLFRYTTSIRFPNIARTNWGKRCLIGYRGTDVASSFKKGIKNKIVGNNQIETYVESVPDDDIDISY